MQNATPTLASAAGAGPVNGDGVTLVGFPGSVGSAVDETKARASFKTGAVSSRQIIDSGVSETEVNADISGGAAGSGVAIRGERSAGAPGWLWLPLAFPVLGAVATGAGLLIFRSRRRAAPANPGAPAVACHSEVGHQACTTCGGSIAPQTAFCGGCGTRARALQV